MFLNSFKSIWFLIAITSLVLIFLVSLAYNQSWRYHLDSDVWGFYYPRLLHFLQNFSFAGIGENEYFPGAMFFFLTPGLALIFGPNGASTYLAGLIAVNILIVVILLHIYRKHNPFSPFIFLAILLFAGPIIFYRHDLFVSIVVIASILLWQKRRERLAAFTLGIATSIKVYPVIILPYLAMLVFKNKSLKEAIKTVSFFISGLILVLIPYFFFGASPGEVIDTLKLNSIKPVHVESTWGSLLTIIAKVSDGQWAKGLGAHGIFGIDPKYILLSLTFYNYFWIFPVSSFYIYLNNHLKNQMTIRFDYVFLVLLIFLLFSKILTPQYLFWILPLLPLLDLKSFGRFSLRLTVVTASLIVFLSQYIYPLHYNELLGIFYVSGDESKYFYILLARNILLIVLFILVFRATFRRRETHHEAYSKD